MDEEKKEQEEKAVKPEVVEEQKAEENIIQITKDNKNKCYVFGTYLYLVQFLL